MALERVTAAYAKQVESVATETRRRLLAIWDSLAPWEPADIDKFHDIAKPLVQAAAQAGVDMTTVYAETLFPGLGGQASELIAGDAAARLYDPADRIGRLVANGTSFEEAAAAARQVVDDIGHDSVYRSARQSMAEVAPPRVRWQRRATAKTCKWCLSLAAKTFDSAAQATFGHSHCDCLPVPAEATAAHNRALIDAAGGDLAVKNYKQAGQLKSQERNARRRSEQARTELLTETDPARRERLSTREQEWETRAERAAERRRLLETGSHLP